MLKRLISMAKYIRLLIASNKIYFLLTIIFIPSILSLLQPGYFSMHDDLQVFRLLDFNKCLMDGQIPCVWIPDGGFGYGYPMFGFYPPLPYILSESFFLLGVNLFWSIKIMFILSLILSGFFMYKLAKVFFGKVGGIISSVFYVYGPYHALDIYVRGAANEAWGMVWFPLILLYSYQLIHNTNRRNSIYLALSYAALLLSHNVMTLIFTPFLAIWCLFWVFRLKKLSSLKNLVLSGLWGVGLASFFFLPVVLEKNSVHVETMTIGYFNYLAHFADVKQMFLSRFWGYGGSTWGPNDEMAQPIGHFHWILALIAFITIFIKHWNFGKHKNKKTAKNNSLDLIVIISIVTGLFYAFLSHSRSVWFWDHLPLLYYAQFPWRLLTMVTLLFSFTAGYLFKDISFRKTKRIIYTFPIVLILGVIVWNYPFFQVNKLVTATRQEKFSGNLWELQVTAGIFDYLPKTASRPPGSGSFYLPKFMQGKGAILNYTKGSNWLKFDTKSNKPSQIMAPIFVYTGMSVKINGAPVKFTYDKDLGRLLFSLPSGENNVFIKIYPTKARILGVLISLASLVYLIKELRYERKSTS